MPPRLTYQQVKDYVENTGCKLITLEYSRNKLPLTFECSCDAHTQFVTTLEQFKTGVRCSSCKIDRLKATNRERYGCDYVSQRPETKQSACSGMLKYANEKKWKFADVQEYYTSHGCQLLETEYKTATAKMSFRCVCGNIGRNTMSKFQSGQRCSTKACMDARKKQTNLSKFGAISYTGTPEYKERAKATNLIRYGTESPTQSPIVQAKIEKSGLRFKTYTFPSGRQVKVQGYEPLALDHLLKTFSEDQLLVERTEQPEIWYVGQDEKKHRYFSDIFIPNFNKIIEVKSKWTYARGMKQGKLMKQKQAVIEAGYEYELFIFNDRNQRVDPSEI